MPRSGHVRRGWHGQCDERVSNRDGCHRRSLGSDGRSAREGQASQHWGPEHRSTLSLREDYSIRFKGLSQSGRRHAVSTSESCPATTRQRNDYPPPNRPSEREPRIRLAGPLVARSASGVVNQNWRLAPAPCATSGGGGVLGGCACRGEMKGAATKPPAPPRGTENELLLARIGVDVADGGCRGRWSQTSRCRPRPACARGRVPFGDGSALGSGRRTQAARPPARGASRRRRSHLQAGEHAVGSFEPVTGRRNCISSHRTAPSSWRRWRVPPGSHRGDG